MFLLRRLEGPVTTWGRPGRQVRGHGRADGISDGSSGQVWAGPPSHLQVMFPQQGPYIESSESRLFTGEGTGA